MKVEIVTPTTSELYEDAYKTEILNGQLNVFTPAAIINHPLEEVESLLVTDIKQSDVTK